MKPLLDDTGWTTLQHNGGLLADAALQALADEIDTAAAPAAGVDRDTEPVIDLDAMDLSALDGLDADLPPAQDPQAAQAEAAALLAHLPHGLPPLTGPLDAAGFNAWLALYREGHDGLHRLVALLQRTAVGG